MNKGEFISMLEAGAGEDRAARVTAAQRAPADWVEIASAPKDGRLLDVKFVVETAEPGMAEFYARGCTHGKGGSGPVIENVAFVNGSFKPVIDGEGARFVASLGGGRGAERGTGYGIASVTLSHWGPAA